MPLIAILGKRGVGKSTSAEYLEKKWGFKERAFADPLKKVCAELFMFSEEQLYTELKDEVDEVWGFSPRSGMQKTGDALRITFPRIFVGSFNAWYTKRTREHNGHVVISDCRLKEEAEYVKDMGGVIIKIVREKKEQDEEVDKHWTETSVDMISEYDEVLENNGSLEDLYNRLDDIIRKYVSDDE